MDQDITIVRDGRKIPFSRGILAQMLSQAGAKMEFAYRIASEVRSDLLAEERYVVEEEEVLARLRAKLQVSDAITVSWMDKWQVLRESSEPIIVLIGGATGVGTSTLAADVARRLNIQSVIGTDSVREVLRRAISQRLLPTLHRSSYDVRPQDIRIPIEKEDTVLYGFRAQATQVSIGVEAIIDRGIKEGTNLVIEGVHLVPGITLNQYRDHPNVCFMVVYLSDEEVHRNRFHLRALSTSTRRPAEEYLDHFAEIRRIHDHIFESAKRTGVHLVENISIEAASDAAVEIVSNRISGIAENIRLRRIGASGEMPG